MPGTKRDCALSNNKVDESKPNKRLFKKEEAAVTTAASETEKVEKESTAADHIAKGNELHKGVDQHAYGSTDQVPVNNTSISMPTTTTTPTRSGPVILGNPFNECSLTTWWHVDLQADPAPRQGATLLVRRCMKAYGWTEAKTRSVLQAYRQFLFIKKQKKDWNAEILSPSSSVDQMWHQHILDVVNYCYDCMLLCGFVVSHNPDGMYDEEGRNRRRNATREALLEHFPNVVDRSANGEWKEIFPNEVREIIPNEPVAQASASGALNGNDILTLEIRKPSGDRIFVKLKSNTRMGRVYQCIAQKMGVHEGVIRLLRDGDKIFDHDTPRKLGLRNHEQIDVVLPQYGC